MSTARADSAQPIVRIGRNEVVSTIEWKTPIDHFWIETTINRVVLCTRRMARSIRSDPGCPTILGREGSRREPMRNQARRLLARRRARSGGARITCRFTILNRRLCLMRVPLPIQGVALLFLTATMAVGQTPLFTEELPFDTGIFESSDMLRQVAYENSHPLLILVVDGQLTSLDSASTNEPSRLTPTPQVPPKAKAATEEGEIVSEGIECPNCLPFAAPAKHHKWFGSRHAHKQQAGFGNSDPYWQDGDGGYLSWYGAPLTPYKWKNRGSHFWSHKPNCTGFNGCGSATFGGGYFDSWGCGTPYLAPAPPTHSLCKRCQRKHARSHQNNFVDDGWIGDDGFCDGCAVAAPPQKHGLCRKCQRKSGRGYAGSGYPCWPAYPVPGANVVDDNGFGFAGCPDCGKHPSFCRSLLQHFHRHKSHRANEYPTMGYEPFCDGCISE
jgi:hypothetical protein